jgi:hypothetical protein
VAHNNLDEQTKIVSYLNCSPNFNATRHTPKLAHDSIWMLDSLARCRGTSPTEASTALELWAIVYDHSAFTSLGLLVSHNILGCAWLGIACFSMASTIWPPSVDTPDFTHMTRKHIARTKGEQNGCRQRLEDYLSCQQRFPLAVA